MDLVNRQSHQADLNYLRNSMNMPLLEHDHEKQLTQSWHSTRNEKALHSLIRSYIRLVISIALRYRHYGLPVADLIQEGTLGLLQAAERFDPKREVRKALWVYYRQPNDLTPNERSGFQLMQNGGFAPIFKILF